MKYILNIFSILANLFNCLFSLLFSGLKSKKLVYTTSRGRKKRLDLYLPDDNRKTTPLIIFFHGGGWMSGGRKIIEPGVLRQVKRGYAVASVSYSFIPWRRWPNQAYEIKAAVRWLRTNAEAYNLDADKFLIWGVSAGAHLVNVLGCSNSSQELEGDLEPRNILSEVQGVVSWYGFSDFSQMGKNGFFAFLTNIATSFLVGERIKMNTAKTQNANPINYINHNTPPFFIMHGAKDTIVNIHQSELLHAALQQQGIQSTYTRIPNYFHADVRFNREIHIKKIEEFMDEI
ncbi:MAG: alpha/beta hydrolase fold domain-containing protein [Saprospiraceae bacterium]